MLNVGEPNGLKPFLKELSVYTQPKEFCLTQDMTEENRKQLMDSLANYKRIVVGITVRKLSAYKSFFDNFAPSVPVTFVAFVSGKELVPIEKCMAKAGAVVLAHSSEDDVQCQVAKILYGKACANGRLSASIGSLFAAGAGTDVGPRTVPHFIPEEHGMNSQNWRVSTRLPRKESVEVLIRVARLWCGRMVRKCTTRRLEHTDG